MQLQYQGGNVTAPEGMTLQYKVPENINSFLIYKEMYHEGRFSEYEVLQHGSFAKDEIPRDGNVTLQSSTQTSAENAYWERTLHWKSEDKASYDNTTELLLYNGVAEEYAADQVRTKEKYKLAETSDIIIGAWHLESQNSGVSAIPCKTLMEAEGDARRKLLGKNAGIILWHVVLSEKDSETLAKEYEVSGLARKLYALRTPYIGNASAVGKLLQELNISVLGKFTMELETSEEPYVLRMNFEKEPQKGDVFEKAMFDYAVLMLSLVENAGEVQWTYPMEGGQTLYTGYCDAAAANAFAHTDDIKKESESVQQLQKMMDYIGFSEKEVVQVVHTEDGYLAPDGEIYRYRTVVKGTLPNASRSSIYVVYSDKKDITFEEVSDHFLSSMLKKEPRMYVSLDELKERR